jgi:hypothetical protein
MNYIEYYKTRKLLSDGKSNTKMAKNKTKTYALSLIPHSLNSKGENLCKFSTKECRAMCLNMTGRAGFTMVQQARLNKTDFFVYHKQEFVTKLYNELVDINKKGEKCLIRLNVVSDVPWADEFQSRGYNLAELQNITFYAYTKDPFQIENNVLPNQHFTFSYSGGNWKWCEKFLKEKKANVAVVFKKELPLEYNGFKVINGDLDDERVLDEKGVIVGLKYKVPRGVKYEPNKFVVE